MGDSGLPLQLLPKLLRMASLPANSDRIQHLEELVFGTAITKNTCNLILRYNETIDILHNSVKSKLYTQLAWTLAVLELHQALGRCLREEVELDPSQRKISTNDILEAHTKLEASTRTYLESLCAVEDNFYFLVGSCVDDVRMHRLKLGGLATLNDCLSSRIQCSATCHTQAFKAGPPLAMQALVESGYYRDHAVTQSGDDILPLKMWCVISGAEYDATLIHTYFFVSPCILQVQAKQLFGAGSSHTFSNENAITVHVAYAEMLNAGNLSIMPVQEDKDGHFQLVVLDDSGTTTEHLQRFSDLRVKAENLHETRLTFRTDLRPKYEYVVFRYAMDLLRYKTRATTSLTLPDGAIQPWLGSLPNGMGLMLALSHYIGCISLKEAFAFWALPDENCTYNWVRDDTRCHAHMIWLALLLDRKAAVDSPRFVPGEPVTDSGEKKSDDGGDAKAGLDEKDKSDSEDDDYGMKSKKKKKKKSKSKSKKEEERSAAEEDGKKSKKKKAKEEEEEKKDKVEGKKESKSTDAKTDSAMDDDDKAVEGGQEALSQQQDEQQQSEHQAAKADSGQVIDTPPESESLDERPTVEYCAELMQEMDVGIAALSTLLVDLQGTKSASS